MERARKSNDHSCLWCADFLKKSIRARFNFHENFMFFRGSWKFSKFDFSKKSTFEVWKQPLLRLRAKKENFNTPRKVITHN